MHMVLVASQPPNLLCTSGSAGCPASTPPTSSTLACQNSLAQAVHLGLSNALQVAGYRPLRLLQLRPERAGVARLLRACGAIPPGIYHEGPDPGGLQLSAVSLPPLLPPLLLLLLLLLLPAPCCSAIAVAACSMLPAPAPSPWHACRSA